MRCGRDLSQVSSFTSQLTVSERCMEFMGYA